MTHGANTYGPNQYPEKLLPLFVTNLLDGEPVPVYGDGQRREWLFVEDHLPRSSAPSGRASPARPTTSAAREQRRTCQIDGPLLGLTGAAPHSSGTSRTGGHDRRYAIDTPQGSVRARLGSRRRSLAVGFAADRRVVSPPTARGGSRSSGEFREYYEKQYAARLA